MALISNENSDLLQNCAGLSKSMFTEIFNKKLWEWYMELGLVSNRRPREYLHVVNGKLLFDEDIEKNIYAGRNFFAKLLSGMKFSAKCLRLLSLYNPGEIEREYKKSLYTDYSSLSGDELKCEFRRLWSLLIENFRYSILAGLITIYRMKVRIDDAYQRDFVAERVNALIDLNIGNLSRKEFDERFGFLSDSDYDFSCPRYSEMRKIKVAVNEKLTLKEGPHNFREHIKFHNIMIIAVIRRLLLSTKNKDIFSMSKEEVVSFLENKNNMVKTNKSRAAIKSPTKKQLANNFGKKESLAKSGIKVMRGVCFSGDGEIEADIHIIKDVKQYRKSFKDSIIITKNLNPDLVMLLPSIAGMIAENGGRLSHLAVVARERNFPLIGQVEDATEILKSAKKVRMFVKEGRIMIIK